MRLLLTFVFGLTILLSQVYLGMKTFFPEAQVQTTSDITEEIISSKAPVLDKISQTDLAWLSKNPTIRLGTDPNFYPVETFDERGKYIGLGSDYLKIIAHLTGLNFMPIHGLDWTGAEASAQEGNIDMFMAVVETPRRGEYLDFTSSYLQMPGMIMTRRNDTNQSLSITDLDNKKVIVVENYYWHDYLAEHNPNIQLILAPNTITALQMLASGEADALVDFEFNLLEKVQVGGFFQLENAGIINPISGHSIAVRDDLSELYNIISIALASISAEEREQLANKWLNEPQSSSANKQLQWYFFFFTQAALVCIGVIIWGNSKAMNALQQYKEKRKNALAA